MCCLLALIPAELFGDLKAEGSLGSTDWEMIKLRIQGGWGRGIGRKQGCNPGLEEERLWPVQDSESSRRA